MTGARKTTLESRVEPALVAAAEQAIREALALPLGKLTRVKLTAEAKLELERQLVARGLERTAKAIRVPVDAQIAALVEDGRRVPLKDVPKRIKGAPRTEITAAITRLLRAGRARVVVRTAAEVLVGGAEAALDPAEIAALKKLSADLVKTVKKVSARGHPRSLLREDLAALLAAITPIEHAVPSRTRITEAIRRLEDPALKLVRVPDLVRALDGQLALAEVHRALLEEAERGTIELRPEAGAEFLADADARLCPPGPRGTVFSYVRLRSP